MRIATTKSRVPRNTSQRSNQRIHQETDARVAYYAEHPELIGQRLEELDREWDIERTLEAGATTLTLTGVLLGTLVNRRWLLLSLGVQGFFMQHVLQGWCPPLPALRKMGVRTSDEINRERYALKQLRGDFKNLQAPSDVKAISPARLTMAVDA